MPEPVKRKTTRKKKAKATRRKVSPKAEEKKQEKADSPEEDTDLFGRADQLGAILAKGLDMAEAGLSLGLTVINRVGAAAQEQIFDRFTVQPQGPPPATGAAPAEAAEAPAQEAEPPPGRGAPEVTVPEEERYCITNRIPLAPGGETRVSFSINNDSLSEPKKVRLSVDGFTGESGGAVLPGTVFAVKPARKTIAPMDFEKFVLEGPIPDDLPPDVYRGRVVVSSGSDFGIPVRLVVMSP